MIETRAAYQAGPATMSYFAGDNPGRSDDYLQAKTTQPLLRYRPGSIPQYRDPGNGYQSPDSVSPYRSPAMQEDYSPSPSRQFMEAQMSPPSEGPGNVHQHDMRQRSQNVPARTNSIVDRMEGIEVSSTRDDVNSPSEATLQQRAAERAGLVDGRGEGNVVMQHSIDNSGTRRQYPDGRIGVLPPGESSSITLMGTVPLTEISEAPRSYTAVKLVGDGSFGTVWLCDWSSPMAPETKLSAMQCGAGARPEWVEKRLVAVKRMKRVWEGGWKQASKLGELVVSLSVAEEIASP